MFRIAFLSMLNVSAMQAVHSEFQFGSWWIPVKWGVLAQVWAMECVLMSHKPSPWTAVTLAWPHWRCYSTAQLVNIHLVMFCIEYNNPLEVFVSFRRSLQLKPCNRMLKLSYGRLFSKIISLIIFPNINMNSAFSHVKLGIWALSKTHCMNWRELYPSCLSSKWHTLHLLFSFIKGSNHFLDNFVLSYTH